MILMFRNSAGGERLKYTVAFQMDLTSLSSRWSLATGWYLGGVGVFFFLVCRRGFVLGSVGRSFLVGCELLLDEVFHFWRLLFFGVCP